MSKPKEYEIQQGKIEPTWMIPSLADQGFFAKDTVRATLYTPADFREEQEGISRFNPADESPQFDRNRTHFREAIKAVMKHFFTEHKLPTENGLDFGCGATGTMVHCFLDRIVNRNTWTEADINPSSVASNRSLHPDSKIYTGSYHDVSTLGLSGNMDIVTGLSTLDATQFIPHAIGQIREALRSGGYLFHVQDVRPGRGAGIRELKAMGQIMPYECLTARNSNTEQDFMAFRTPGGIISSGELFRRQMGRAFKEDGGYEVLVNDWVRSVKPVPGKVSRIYYQNIDMQYVKGNPPATHEAYVIMSLAKKK